MATINQQVHALVKQKFGPAARQLAAQLPREQNWFGQYQQAIQNAAAQSAAANQAAVAQVGQLQQGVNSSAAQQWAGQQAQMQSDANVRGAQTSPGLADIAHNAANVRGNITGTYGGLLATTGANQQNYLANRGTVAAQQGLEAKQATQGARRELATQRGDFAATTKQQLIADAQAAAQKAADNAFRRYIQKSQLAISEQNASTSAANAQTSRDLGYARLGVEQQNANTSQYRARHPQSSAAKQIPASGPGALTRSKEQEYISQINTVAALLRNPPVDKNGNPLTVDDLRTGDNPLGKAFDPRVINVARSLVSNKGAGIGPWGVGNAHNLGIHVGGNFKIVRKAAPKGRSLLSRVTH